MFSSFGKISDYFLGPRNQTCIILRIRNLSKCVCVRAKSLKLCLFVTQWTVVSQVPLSMGFFRQGHWSGLPCPSPGHLPNPGIDSMFLMSGRFFTTITSWGALQNVCVCVCVCIQLWINPSVAADSLGPHGLYPARLLCPWNSLGKNTGVGSHSLL